MTLAFWGADDPKTYTKTVRYGVPETKALQPGLFDSYGEFMRMGGTPSNWLYRQPLNATIEGAYAKALSELKGSGAGASAGRLGKAQTTNVANLWGGIGQGALAAKGQTAGNMASYLAQLTSQRPQYAMKPKTESGWEKFQSGMGKIDALANYAARAAGAGSAAFGAMFPPAAPSQMAMGNTMAGATAAGAMGGSPFMQPWTGYSPQIMGQQQMLAPYYRMGF